ncbi:hypothetical protein V1512DRAFT_264212 [Lipomyces arxii]|uniref:uncharacterized protein n=1 Tax=Lipomyces arxii TaxID=56418 RepID=UPI0034CD63EE
MTQIVLPGDPISVDQILDTEAMTDDDGPVVQLGPGMLHVPPETIVPVRAGTLTTLHKQHATTVYIDNTTGRYVPAEHDNVVATIVSRFGDLEKSFYRVAIPGCTAPFGVLSSAAFANALSRKSRPTLAPGTTIYARVKSMSAALGEPELECFDEKTGKEGGYGELKNGMVTDVSVGLARRLLAAPDGRPTVVDVLGKLVPFEIAVGRNGRIWIDSESSAVTVAIMRALHDTEYLPQDQMEAKVAKLIKAIRK